VEFFEKVFAALKQHDPIFDEDSVTVISTTHGRPILVPYLSDVENVAVLTSETASASETDISNSGQALIGAWSYRSPILRASLESAQDLEAGVPLIEIFRRFATDRIARGVAKDLLLGSSKTVGLLPSLLALPLAIGAIASGSNVNDGLGGAGISTISSDDIVDLYFSVDAEFRASDQCAFWANDSTLLALSKQKDKNGRPLLDLNAPRLTLLGKPVKVSPNMPSIGASTTPIAFGDFSYWATRKSIGTGYIKRYSQTLGLIEQGKVGLRAFARFDGALLFDDTNSAPPIRLLQMMS
jgi:HK97 family phage major capsid protein